MEGWRVQRRRYTGSFSALLRGSEDRTFWSADKMQDFRNERLHDFVQHSARSVPFYKRRFQDCGISPTDIRTLNDLRHIPILTKEEVQEHYLELISESVPKRQQIITHTSGTTGGGLRFATTMQAIQEQFAVWWRYRRWHGLQPLTWGAHFAGRSVVPLSQSSPPFWRYNYPGRQILFSGYHMSPANLGSYVNELRRRRPRWFHGYPSLLALLAAYVLESGMKLGYEVRWITIGSENLLPQQADLIEQAFHVRPKQHYGMTEAVANISECENGMLHVDEDFAAVEFIPNPDGPGFKVIGTNYTNPATPLLRYDIKDMVTLTEAACSCGRPGRVVANIDGRLEDYVVLKNGACLGRMDHIFKDMINIREAQIYQTRPGEMTIRVVRGSSFTDADERALLRETMKRVGADTEIHIEYVSTLERSSTGKLRFVVSNISKDYSVMGARY